MRYLWLGIAFFSLSVPAAETVRDGLLRQLRTIQRQISEEKVNLKNSESNLTVVESDFEKLKRLESEHVQLKSDLQEQIKNNPNLEKGKARETFLFKAGKLDGEVGRQLGEIRSRFGPLQKEKESWLERKAKYEKSVAALSKQELEIQEKLGPGIDPTPTPENDPKTNP